MEWKEKLRSILSIAPLEDEPMSLHTSLRVGGPAEFLIYPQNIYELQEILKLARNDKIPFFVLGRGTNLLVLDGGIPGIVISLAEVCCNFSFSNSLVRAGAGVPLARLVSASLEKGLSGLEFALGIPGSLGGALYMNAGAFGCSIGDLVQEATVIDFEGNIISLSRSQLSFSYRWSSFKQEKAIILEAVLKLVPGKREEIWKRARSIQEERRLKHPQFPSAGSVFRNPPGGKPAGYLIERAGAKGLAVGGAEVSLKHGNFIVNKGNATAADVLALIEVVRKRVKESQGVELELEIEIVGKEGSE